jgi:hypothetical protein
MDSPRKKFPGQLDNLVEGGFMIAITGAWAIW